ncbi:MAG: helix-turn-helix transcriptional regulator [Clostridia bacterium]|nr:helix-turn-helix transcriptional regulator [Clostridia bacterium]
MSADFALRLTDLRKEKNLSQKEAASCLGVSQALLSHYEKGIRECKLDFLKKACDYYDVTSDYLLGFSDNRQGINDVYIKTELETDSELKIKTIFRSIVSLVEKLSASGDTAENRLKEEMLLSVYRFAILSAKCGISDKDWFSIDVKDGEMLASGILDRMFAATKQKDKMSEYAYSDEPEFLKTIIYHAEELISERYNKMLNNKREDV